MSPAFSLARMEAIWGYLFISPWIVGFILLTAIPMVATLVFTFTNITLTGDEPLRFVGLENYEKMFERPAHVGRARRHAALRGSRASDRSAHPVRHRSAAQ